MTIYRNTIGAVKYGSTVFHVTNLDMNPSQEVTPINVDGVFAPVGYALLQAKPMATFTVVDLATTLSTLSLEINSITSDNMTLYCQNLLNEGIRSAGSTHTSYGITAGALVINTISATQGGIASAHCSLYASSSDGITSPWTVTENGVALPAETNLASIYSLGTTSLNGTSLEGITSWTINLNNQVQQQLTDGNLYPQWSALMSHAPTITVNSADPGSVRTLIGNSGLNLASGGLVLTLYETTNGVITTSVGNTLTAALGMATCNTRSNSQGQLSTSGFTVATAYNLTGPVNPIVIS